MNAGLEARFAPYALCGVHCPDIAVLRVDVAGAGRTFLHTFRFIALLARVSQNVLREIVKYIPAHVQS